MIKNIFITTSITIFSFITLFGQQKISKTRSTNKPSVATSEPGELYKQIKKVDSILFNALNNCDSVEYRKYFIEDLEFYHDQGGLTLSLDSEMQSFGQACARHTHIRRELIENTLEVYKIGNYGAVEIGVHRFFHTNKGETEHLSGAYKFIHVWQRKDEQWKISRIISYGHDNMNNN